MTIYAFLRCFTGRNSRQLSHESMASSRPKSTIAARTIPPAMVIISLLPMTPGLFGGVAGSRAVMGAHISTALCDVTPNMRWTSKGPEAQQNERLSPHSAQVYHQEAH